MIEQEIERKIEDFRELGIPEYIKREGLVPVADNIVSTIIGARRAGKSFRAIQVADELMDQNVIKSIHQICLIDFDNPVLSIMKAQDLKLIQDTFLKLNPEFELNTSLIFILDEIHKIPGWEEYVIDLSRNPKWKVIVTGSSSKLLKGDIATELRGKSISSTIYPLSFNEFLKFKHFKHKPSSTKGQAELRRLFDEYLKWGAYPAIARVEEYTKEALLREYFDTMILKDIIQRYNVSKPQQCIHLYNYLLSNISKDHTLQSAFRYLKHSGFSTSRDTVREYIHWAEDSWLLFMVPIYSNSLKEQERNYKKIYSIDWALANKNSLVWDGSYSRALENLVFIHLYRRWYRVHYYLTGKKRQEVDFIAIDKNGYPSIAVQVCMEMSQEYTLKCELESIIATARYFGIKDNFIVTYNQEMDFHEQGVSVKAMPAWKWMLSEEGG
jgi:predicted AAA+ superfamily ATPase